MLNVRPAKILRAVIFATTGCLVAAAVYMSILIHDRQTALSKNETARLNVAFNVSQAALALTRTLHSISSLQVSPGPAQVSQAQLRTQILKGWTEVLPRGLLTAFVDSSPSRHKLIQNFIAAVTQAEEDMPRLANSDVQAAIIERLNPFESDFAGLLAEANSYNGDLISDDEMQLGHLFTIFSLLGTTLVLLCLTLVIVTYRQNLVLEAKDKELRAQNMCFNAALNNMNHGLTLYDSKGHLIVSNKQYASLFGLAPEQIRVGMHFEEVLRITHRGSNATNLSDEDLLASRRKIFASTEPNQFLREHVDGRALKVLHQPLKEGGWVLTIVDVTERRRNEAKISFMALHDSLTSLPNRRQFNEKLHEVLQNAETNGSNKKAGLAIHLIDIDNFKNINDAHGHPVGDALLKEIARRLKSCVRRHDLVARFGGDEFAILQQHVNGAEEAAHMATRITEQMNEVFHLDNVAIMSSASIGIALAPQEGTQISQLLKRADLALYRSKANGKGTFSYFEPNMDTDAEIRRLLGLDLRQAVQCGELVAHYQPLVNVKSGDISGFEALLRWQHPTRGLISPINFIPLAEESGLINTIGEWILLEACREAASWPEPFNIAVNISPIQIKSRNLVQVVMNALETTGLPAERLELEITESVFLQENETTLATLQQLRELGVRFSLDDFGTGYSSLSCLRSFPFDKLKIDRSFIKDVGLRGNSGEIVHAVINLGRSLGINTTAEGVETKAQLEMLRAEGCTELQGYLFGKPVPASELGQFLDNQTRVIAA